MSGIIVHRYNVVIFVHQLNKYIIISKSMELIKHTQKDIMLKFIVEGNYKHIWGQSWFQGLTPVLGKLIPSL